MTVPYRFEFPSGTPSKDEIFKIFELKTGLTIVSEPFSEFHTLIKISNFEEVLIVSFRENRIGFNINHFIIGYFSASFISTLIHLGGKFNDEEFQLPFWSDMKWDDLLTNWTSGKYDWIEIKTDEAFDDLIWDNDSRVEQYDKKLTSWYRRSPIIFVTA